MLPPQDRRWPCHASKAKIYTALGAIKNDHPIVLSERKCPTQWLYPCSRWMCPSLNSNILFCCGALDYLSFVVQLIAFLKDYFFPGANWALSVWVSEDLSPAACRRPWLPLLERTKESDVTNCATECLAAHPLAPLCPDARINYSENTDSLHFRHETHHPKTGEKGFDFFFSYHRLVGPFGNRMHYLFFTKATLMDEKSFLLFLVGLLEKQASGLLCVPHTLPGGNCELSSNCSK